MISVSMGRLIVNSIMLYGIHIQLEDTCTDMYSGMNVHIPESPFHLRVTALRHHKYRGYFSLANILLFTAFLLICGWCLNTDA